MISADIIGRGLERYLWNKVQEDYYFNGGEPPPIWLTTALAKHFKLSGQIRRKDLRNFLRGFDQHGKKLVRNAGKADGKRKRHMGMSYVFNADKNWSIVWALADPKLRAAMEAAFQRAVERTIREYIEKEVARCRLRDGTEVVAKILGAIFIHSVSREGDMHFHGHVLLPSGGLCPDGNTRALVSKNFFDHKLDAGAYFRVCLEQETRELGLQFYRPLNAKGELKSYSVVAGIPDHVRRHFSKRREQIDEKLGGKASAAASAVATMQTRRGKETVEPREKSLPRWAKEAASLGFSLESAIRPARAREEIDHTKEYSRAVRTAAEECTQQEGHFQRREIFREMLVAAQGRGGADPSRLCTFLDHDLDSSRGFVNLGIRNKVQRFSVPEVLQVEKELIEHVEQMRRAKFVPVPEKIVSKAIAKQRHVNPSQATTPIGKLCDALCGDKRSYTLDAEQQACLRDATQSPGRVKTIYGPAGSSKSTVAAAIAEAYQAAGYKIYNACISGSAAKNFWEKTGVPSDTVCMTLRRLYPDPADLAKHHTRQLWRAARGKSTYKFDQLKLDSKTVFFVDEASMVGTRDFALLAKACDRTNAVMICLGDNRQLPAIDQGGAFGSIIDRCGGFELQAIKRQESEKERQRVKQLYRGETEAVIKAYAEDGKLHVARTHTDAHKELIRNWTQNGGVDAPKDHAIFAATRYESRCLNDMAQQARLEAGKLTVRQTITVNEETYYRGDRIRFLKKSRKLQLENGDAGTIVSIRNNPLSAAVKVLIDGEKRAREIPIRTLTQTHYDGLTRAYASTVHAMQGRTVDHSYCSLMGSMTDRELTYVAFSRHRKSLQIFTDENHAGVALTNTARKATREGKTIKAKPGLKAEYSPLIKQASKSRVKTLATDHQTLSSLILKLKKEP